MSKDKTYISQIELNVNVRKVPIPINWLSIRLSNKLSMHIYASIAWLFKSLHPLDNRFPPVAVIAKSQLSEELRSSPAGLGDGMTGGPALRRQQLREAQRFKRLAAILSRSWG